MAEPDNSQKSGTESGTATLEKPWFSEYKDDGKATAFTPDELKGIPENLKPRLERLSATVAEATKVKTPEKYELKLPEKTVLDAKRTEDVAAFAKANGLTNETAQAILDREHSLLSSKVEADSKAWKETTDGWAKQAAEDKEIGGAKLKESLALTKQVITKFGGADFLKLVDENYMISHPDFLKMMVRIGSGMSSDQLVVGHNTEGTPAAKTPLEKLYPSHFSKK